MAEAAHEQRDRNEVGQFLPGNPHAFPPGVSGNPGGRPRGSSVTAPLLRLLAKDENEHGEGRLAVAHAQRLLDIALGKAIGEDPKTLAAELKAIALTMERTDGRVLQEVKNSGEPTHVTRVVVEMPKDAGR